MVLRIVGLYCLKVVVSPVALTFSPTHVERPGSPPRRWQHSRHHIRVCLWSPTTTRYLRSSCLGHPWLLPPCRTLLLTWGTRWHHARPNASRSPLIQCHAADPATPRRCGSHRTRFHHPLPRRDADTTTTRPIRSANTCQRTVCMSQRVVEQQPTADTRRNAPVSSMLHSTAHHPTSRRQCH